jgi:hypothetical protein
MEYFLDANGQNSHIAGEIAAWRLNLLTFFGQLDG